VQAIGQKLESRFQKVETQRRGQALASQAANAANDARKIIESVRRSSGPAGRRSRPTIRSCSCRRFWRRPSSVQRSGDRQQPETRKAEALKAKSFRPAFRRSTSC